MGDEKSLDDELVEAGVFTRLDLRLARGVSEQEITRAAVRELRKIYRCVCDIRKEQNSAYAKADIKPEGKLKIVTASEFVSQPIKSRIDSVDTAERGLGYAARMIGVMVYFIGGDELLERVGDAFFDLFNVSDRDFQFAASWLTHRWDCIGNWYA